MVSVFAIIIYALLSAFDTCLLLRAIFSWIPSLDESKVEYFLKVVTEPVVEPVRNILINFSWVQRCPIDIAFIVVWILTGIFSSIAYSFI